jgi:hypothetical protein
VKKNQSPGGENIFGKIRTNSSEKSAKTSENGKRLHNIKKILSDDKSKSEPSH